MTAIEAESGAQGPPLVDPVERVAAALTHEDVTSTRV